MEMKYPAEFFRSLPKVDLHRHLEGSIRIKTLSEIGRNLGIHTKDTAALRPLVEVGEDEPYTFENFLSKFATLRLFYRSPDVIGRITREAIEDAAKDNVRHLELRFTPFALSKAEGFPLDQVMDWVIEGARSGDEEYGVTTRLIASVNRHESPDLAEQVAWLAMERKYQGIVGLDLAGNEAEFPADPFLGILKEAKQEGLNVTIHAGEWGGASNVAQAINEFGANRIGHGVRVVEDASVMELARASKTVFEVCLTSNLQSGVVSKFSRHPFKRMVGAGLNVTLNTDDPSISRITLSEEYRRACEVLDLPIESLKGMIIAAAQAAFIPADEKKTLVADLEKKLNE